MARSLSHNTGHTGGTRTAAPSADGLQVLVAFTLTDSAGFTGEAGWQEHGRYTATFDCLRENERSFLRLAALAPTTA